MRHRIAARKLTFVTPLAIAGEIEHHMLRGRTGGGSVMHFAADPDEVMAGGYCINIQDGSH